MHIKHTHTRTAKLLKTREFRCISSHRRFCVFHALQCVPHFPSSIKPSCICSVSGRRRARILHESGCVEQCQCHRFVEIHCPVFAGCSGALNVYITNGFCQCDAASRSATYVNESESDEKNFLIGEPHF